VEPVRGRDGEVARWFGTNTDVSEQRRLTELTRRVQLLLLRRAGLRTRLREHERVYVTRNGKPAAVIGRAISSPGDTCS